MKISMQKYLSLEDMNNDATAKEMKEFLGKHFKNIFKDLAIRSCSSEAIDQQKLDKATFVEYCKLPGILSDRFFDILKDPNSQSLISESSFVDTFTKIYVSDLEVRMHLTFKMYDFNNDGLICRDDVQIILFYIPFIQDNAEETSSINCNNQNNDHKFDNTSDETEATKQQQKGQIKHFIDQVFKRKDEISFREYLDFNMNTSSEMFISIMALLHDRLPTSKNFFRIKKFYQSKSALLSNSNHSQSPVRFIAQPQMLHGLSKFRKKVTSNPQNNFLSPQASPSNRLEMDEHAEEIKLPKIEDFTQHVSKYAKPNLKVEPQSPITPKIYIARKDVQFANINNNKGGSTPKISQIKRLDPISKEEGDGNFNNHQVRPKSPLALPQRKRSQSKVLPQLTVQLATASQSFQPKSKFFRKGNLQSLNSFSISNNSGGNQEKHHHLQQLSTQHSMKVEKDEDLIDNFSLTNNNNIQVQFKEGDCYLKTSQDNFCKHWAVVMNNDLYCYANKDEAQHTIMHCLSGTFIKVIPVILDEERQTQLWGVQIVISFNTARNLYFASQEEQTEWCQNLKQAAGHIDMLDFYTLYHKLGKGSFGEVKCAINNTTGQTVAIKIVRKRKMNPKKIFQQRREIEILKICNHPNIVRLIDIYENHESYQIVLEYMGGHNLQDYFRLRKYQFGEQRVKELICQLSEAVFFLKQYRIIHRDLKPENIMMTDNTDSAIPKIVDFGISQIISPGEKCDQAIGTLGFAAPEVLSKAQYDFSCDIWSIGCIAYYLLSGNLPFESQLSHELIELTQTAPLQFKQDVWSQISYEAKDFIKETLKKDHEQRITVENLLKHRWLQSVRRV